MFITADKHFGGAVTGEAAGSYGRRSAKNRKSNAAKGNHQDEKVSESETAGFLAV
jgi:hypothetical protein